MLEESADPRPQRDAFTGFLAACAPQSTPPHTIEERLRSWSDQHSGWTNLRDIGHWIERSRS